MMKKKEVIKEFYGEIAEWYDEMYVDKKSTKTRLCRLIYLLKSIKRQRETIFWIWRVVAVHT